MGFTVAMTVQIVDNERAKYNRLKIRLEREYLIDSLTEADYLSQILQV